MRAYIKVLRRIGKVKGFSKDNVTGGNIGFCLRGNSNGIDFAVCDLEGLLRERVKEAGAGRKQLKIMAKESEGILQIEVRLKKVKAIRAHTDETAASKQIADLSENIEGIFLKTFARIIPFGDFCKKGKAAEIISEKVSDARLRRRRLRLLDLIPEKRSLLSAQKALNCRSIGDVTDAFTYAGVSPVTIGKRMKSEHLENLYSYLEY
jgi:hypothetical protein